MKKKLGGILPSFYAVYLDGWIVTSALVPTATGVTPTLLLLWCGLTPSAAALSPTWSVVLLLLRETATASKTTHATDLLCQCCIVTQQRIEVHAVSGTNWTRRSCCCLECRRLLWCWIAANRTHQCCWER